MLINPSSCKGKNWKLFSLQKNANFTDSKRAPAVIYSNSIWGGICLWQSNFKASQKIIIAAILVSNVSQSTSQHDPLIYLSCKLFSVPRTLFLSSSWAEQLWMKYKLRVYCRGLYEMKESNRPLLERAKERAIEKVFVLHQSLFSRKRFK